MKNKPTLRDFIKEQMLDCHSNLEALRGLAELGSVGTMSNAQFCLYPLVQVSAIPQLRTPHLAGIFAQFNAYLCRNFNPLRRKLRFL